MDHLIALYSIESKWPDCTNWSGDGPGGGPSGTYSEPVQWTGTAGHIQETGRNVVAPGATLTATTFILVFHEDPPPQFANWSVNFTFGKSASAPESNADAARTASVPGTPPSADSPSDRELSEAASEMEEMAESDDAICGIPMNEAVSITFILPLESWPEEARPFVIDMRAKNGDEWDACGEYNAKARGCVSESYTSESEALASVAPLNSDIDQIRSHLWRNRMPPGHEYVCDVEVFKYSDKFPPFRAKLYRTGVKRSESDHAGDVREYIRSISQ